MACIYILIFTLTQSDYVAYCLFIETEDALLSHSCQDSSVAESHVGFNMIIWTWVGFWEIGGSYKEDEDGI